MSREHVDPSLRSVAGGSNVNDGREPVVVAIVWTYDRVELAERCVRAVLGQGRPADRVIVVDIASPDGTGARLRTAFPDLEIVQLPANDGPGAAIAAAIDRVGDELPDHFWLVEDDSVPSPSCLGDTLAAAARCDGAGIVGPVGCEIRRGQWYATGELALGELRDVDFVVLDGALVAGEAVRRVGAPRTDFFIMMVDVEYPLRIARAGFRMVQAGVPYRQLRLGSAAPDSEWRHYYQTRNHLRMALDLRAPALLGGFAIRTTKHVVHALAHRRWRSIGLRARGVTDALRGRMGRTVEPPSARDGAADQPGNCSGS